MFFEELLAGPNDVCIERAAETPVSRDNHKKNAFLRTDLEQRMCHVLDAAGKVSQNLPQLVRKRPRTQNTFLRAAQFGRGDGLHGFGQLLCILDRSNPPPDV
jgi:hypothetical protein